MKRYLLLVLVLGGALGYGLGQWLGHAAAPPPNPPKASAVKRAVSAAAQPAVIAAPRTPVEVAALAPPPADLLPAWRRNAALVPAGDGRAWLAIVIDDMGMQPKRLARIAALPGPITLAFLPYGVDLPTQAQAARARGHEIIVHLPMEALHNEDPGPNALMVGLERGEFARRLGWSLDRFTGYVGVNNHMGSKYTRDAAAMAPVMAELKARGLLFLDSRTAPDSVGLEAARRAGVPAAARDVFLDFEQATDKVRAELDRAEGLAHSRGMAIAIGHPHDGTLAVLAERLPGIAQRGVTLVPLSAVVARKLGG